MRKLKYTVDRKTLNSVYITFIRPKLEYASIIWHDCTQAERDLLEGLQLNAARIVTGAKRGTSHERIYLECGWQTLATRRENTQLAQFYKMVNHETPEYLSNLVPNSVGEDVNIVRLRSENKLRTVRCRTTKYQKSFLPNVVNLWNNLDDEHVQVESFVSFKSRLAQDDQVNDLYLYGKRKLSMIHAQLRMYCSNLNCHLFSLPVIDNEQCPCGSRVEDTRHFFMFCPLYDNIRAALVDFFASIDLEINEYNLLHGIDGESIELNLKLFELVHEYIELSGRF